MRPKGQRIVAALRRDLKSAAQGQRLPTVRALMKRFGVSQLVVSQALLTLRNEGLLEAHVGRGSFVRQDARLRRVLWVCGIDLYHGDISPYYAHEMRFIRAACAARGWTFDPVWLSNYRPEESDAYCTPAVMGKYAGFIFTGCSKEHRLRDYVMRHAAVPAVWLAYWPNGARQVCDDFPGAMELGLGHVKASGHEALTLVAPVYKPGEARVVDRIAARLGLRLRLAAFPPVLWASAFQSEGYQLACGLLAEKTLADAIYITDDIVAQGFTRALLAQCPPRRLAKLEIVVRSALQGLLPLGLPVSYVVHDIEQTAARAVALLADQIDGRTGHPDRACTPASLLDARAGLAISGAAQTLVRKLRRNVRGNDVSTVTVGQ